MNTSFTSISYVQDALKAYLASGHQAPATVTSAFERPDQDWTSLNAEDCAFIASAVIETIRKGEGFLPDEQAADMLNRLPLIDHLRQKVLASDLSWIQGAISEQKPELAGLMLSLLRKFDTTPATQGFLAGKWQTASPFLKAHLMWRLLDADSMADDKKREILDFVLNNWSVFNAVSAKFLGAPDTIVSATRSRLADQSFPASKKWSYLCRVVDPATDKSAAKALISLYLNDPDGFTQHVARTLLDRFFPKSSADKPKIES